MKRTIGRYCALPALSALALAGYMPAALAQSAHVHATKPPADAAALSPEAKEFLAENDVAMTRMMAEMDVVPTGDVDRDFVAMMVPHHQGGIDMARAVLRSSRNDRIRRLAQEIIVTQLDEIRAMHLAIVDADAAPKTAISQKD